jgi:DNA-binding winged helix-turn-helix (wHTH) protein
MPKSLGSQSLADSVFRGSWSVLVLCDDVAGARRWSQPLTHEDLRFTCEHFNRYEHNPGAWTTFDLLVLLLGSKPSRWIPPRHFISASPRWMAVLARMATGAERAWWIENGADDCVSQPCEQQELLARLRAALRRQRSWQGGSRSLSIGPLTLWPRERAVTLEGHPLALTTSEFSLLVILAEHAGQVLGREALIELAKGSAEETFERAIDVQISRLRAKLGDDPRRPRLLKTVRGLGYVLVAEPVPAPLPP